MSKIPLLRNLIGTLDSRHVCQMTIIIVDKEGRYKARYFLGRLEEVQRQLRSRYSRKQETVDC